MHYLCSINPLTEEIVTLLENYTVDNVIQAFIKDCVKRSGTTGSQIAKDFNIGCWIEDSEKEHIATLLWAVAEDSDRSILIITRKDRGNNIYFYDTQCQLVKHSDLK